MRGCFARWLSGDRWEKRAVKHGKSGLRAAICALFGTSRGDLCKTVEKLCKSLQGVKTKNTNCAQRFVRLCVLVRELCKYRFRAAFGVWALWCGGAPFGRFPSRLRRRGAHLGGGGTGVDKLSRVAARGGSAIGGQVRSTARGGVRLCPRPPPPCARHFAHQRAKCTAVDKLTREGRTGRGGDCLVHSAFALGDSAHKRRGRGRRRAGAGCCARRRPPLPSPFPTLRSATRGTGSQRRGLFPTAARTLPGSGRRANDILYIRVRRREARTFCTGRRATMWITFPWITHCG